MNFKRYNKLMEEFEDALNRARFDVVECKDDATYIIRDRETMKKYDLSITPHLGK